MQNFYSNGKLLITGEYAVLDGAKSFAIPTKYGQDFVVQNISEPLIIWQSFDCNNKQWFACTFTLPNLEISTPCTDLPVAKILQKIVKEALKLDTKNTDKKSGFFIKTNLSFPRNWGLGSSSTLINNVAKWLNINAFELLNKSFGGSGYDIACAQNNTAICYQLVNKKPQIKAINFNPNFKDSLFFVHLNKKQNSKNAIENYRKYAGNIFAFAEEISQLTNAIIASKNCIDFEKIMLEHEKIIASVIKQKPIQKTLFSDYFGQTKSLGAWGGDFILATGNENTPNYFKNKGFKTVIPYQEMIL